MNDQDPPARTLKEISQKVCVFGYQPTKSEVSLINDFLLELQVYRTGGVTEEILRRNDGCIKVGKGCAIVRYEDVKTEPCIIGKCVEIGDDDNGQPMLLIHTTRQEIVGYRRNVVMQEVEVRLAKGSQ